MSKRRRPYTASRLSRGGWETKDFDDPEQARAWLSAWPVTSLQFNVAISIKFLAGALK